MTGRFAVCCVVLLVPCAARYETEVRLLRETIDLSEDLVDRYRRNADRLQNVYEFASGDRVVTPGGGHKNSNREELGIVALEVAAEGGAGAELTEMLTLSERLSTLLAHMKRVVLRSGERMDAIRQGFSLLLQLPDAAEAAADLRQRQPADGDGATRATHAATVPVSRWRLERGKVDGALTPPLPVGLSRPLGSRRAREIGEGFPRQLIAALRGKAPL